jgi:WXXGXW repeat (2 copies)
MSRVARSLAPLLLALSIAASPSASFAGVYLSVALAPPILPVYELPPIPGPNYLWTPGYWSYADDDYYWVPGTWVIAPRVGLLWTPGYWGWNEGYYVWHTGYWGPHIGYYGGINYGHGYFGAGYAGGHWDHGAFFYNTAVVHVNGTVIHNTYNKTIINNTTITNVSYNGGKGGTTTKASAKEISAEHEHHEVATAQQIQHEQTASKNPALFSKANHGAPKLTAVSTPGKPPEHKAVKHDASLTTTAPLHAKQTTPHEADLTQTAPVHAKQVARDPHKPFAQGQKQVAHVNPQKAGAQHAQHAPHPHPKGKDEHG